MESIYFLILSVINFAALHSNSEHGEYVRSLHHPVPTFFRSVFTALPVFYSVRQNSLLVSQVKGKSLVDQKSDKVFARGFLQVFPISFQFYRSNFKSEM